jgi:hypothetical protein
MNMSTSIGLIAPALLAAQKEMSNAKKGSVNPFFKSKFADLNSVREAVTPALHANGIMLMQPTVHIDGRNFVRTVLMHESGEYFSGDTEIINGKPTDPQANGAAISYSRRYGLSSMLSVGAEDSDAELAVDRTPKVETKPSAPPNIVRKLVMQQMQEDEEAQEAFDKLGSPSTFVPESLQRDVKPSFRKKPKSDTTKVESVVKSGDWI